MDFLFGKPDDSIESYTSTTKAHGGPHYIDMSQFDEVELMPQEILGEANNDQNI